MAEDNKKDVGSSADFMSAIPHTEINNNDHNYRKGDQRSTGFREDLTPPKENDRVHFNSRDRAMGEDGSTLRTLTRNLGYVKDLYMEYGTGQDIQDYLDDEQELNEAIKQGMPLKKASELRRTMRINAIKAFGNNPKAMRKLKDSISAFNSEEVNMNQYEVSQYEKAKLYQQFRGEYIDPQDERFESIVEPEIIKIQSFQTTSKLNQLKAADLENQEKISDYEVLDVIDGDVKNEMGELMRVATSMFEKNKKFDERDLHNFNTMMQASRTKLESRYAKHMANPRIARAFASYDTLGKMLSTASNATTYEEQKRSLALTQAALGITENKLSIELKQQAIEKNKREEEAQKKLEDSLNSLGGLDSVKNIDKDTKRITTASDVVAGKQSDSLQSDYSFGFSGINTDNGGPAIMFSTLSNPEYTNHPSTQYYMSRNIEGVNDSTRALSVDERDEVADNLIDKAKENIYKLNRDAKSTFVGKDSKGNNISVHDATNLIHTRNGGAILVPKKGYEKNRDVVGFVTGMNANVKNYVNIDCAKHNKSCDYPTLSKDKLMFNGIKNLVEK